PPGRTSCYAPSPTPSASAARPMRRTADGGHRLPAQRRDRGRLLMAAAARLAAGARGAPAVVERRLLRAADDLEPAALCRQDPAAGLRSLVVARGDVARRRAGA